MSTLTPGDSPEVMEVLKVPLAVGTPVQFQKVDPKKLEPIIVLGSTPLSGGFVHAAQGTRGYLYDPAREVLVAEDLPGNVHYTCKTTPIERIEIRDGTYYIYTASKSVYQVVVREGELIICPFNEVPVAGDVTAVNARIATYVPPPEQTVAYDRWWWLKAIRDALTRKKTK